MSDESNIPAPPPPPGKGKKPQVEFMLATFQGFYYRAAAQGNEKINYREEVKVPVRLVRDNSRNAQGVFRSLIGPRVLRDKPGYSGIATVHLVDNGPLPAELPLHKQIDWTGSYSQLVALSKQITPAVKPSLYLDSSKLKHAMNLCRQDEKAFIDWQDQRAPGLAEDHMIAEELEALGY